MSDEAVHAISGNLLADLGFNDPDAWLAKAEDRRKRLRQARLNVGALRDLMERVRVATEGTRELDARLYAAFCHPAAFDRMAIPGFNAHDRGSFCWFDTDGCRMTCWGHHAYSRSLDAAVEFSETVLPGWSYRVGKSGSGSPGMAEVWNPKRKPGDGNERRVTRSVGNPPLALLEVALSALIVLAGRETSPETTS